jgi:hypothetical protein
MYSAQFEVAAEATTKDCKNLATIKKLENQQFLPHKSFQCPPPQMPENCIGKSTVFPVK